MLTIADALAPLGSGPLTEEAVARHVRPLFSRVLKRPGIYLANHSLGRPLDQTAADVQEALNLWYERMGDAWEPWLAEMDAFRARVARLINCARPDAVVPKASAGQGLRAVLNAHGTPGTPAAARPIHVVATRGEFDSIDFILRTYAARGRARVTWIDPEPSGMFKPDAILEAIGLTVDLVVMSQVVYATGQVVGGLRRIADKVHAVDGHLLVDCYHAAGAMPFNFEQTGADFAIGGSLKYARGGPGACWLAVHPRHLFDKPRPVGRRHALGTLDTGWLAKHDAWTFERGDEVMLGAGGDAWLEGTPSVLPFYQARSGLEFTLAVGVERLRRYNAEQQGFLRERLAAAEVGVWDFDAMHEPGHGAFLVLPVGDMQTASKAVARLRERGVNVDGRPVPRGSASTGGAQGATPGALAEGASPPPAVCIRLCPDVLTTREEMERAARIVGEVLRL